VVAHGAAIVATNLFLPELDMRPIEVTDVTAHSLGIDILNEENQIYFKPIITRQSAYGSKKGTFITTSRPHQQQVVMNVFRGEDTNPNNNLLLGELSLPISPPQDSLVPIVAIFELDSDGIIVFTAVQLPIDEIISPIINSLDDSNLFELTSSMDDFISTLTDRGLAKRKQVKIDAKQ
jgi:molecular chaperone DnaK (HSP70)